MLFLLLPADAFDDFLEQYRIAADAHRHSSKKSVLATPRCSSVGALRDHRLQQLGRRHIFPRCSDDSGIEDCISLEVALTALHFSGSDRI
jgi:hypothetical protein